MVELAVVCVCLVILVGYLIWCLMEMGHRSAAERRELEDRLMALSQPTALSHVVGSRDVTLQEVKYVDEEEATARTRNAVRS